MLNPQTSIWAPYRPSESAPWNLKRVVHLHRRAAFAAPWDVLQRDLVDGPRAAVDRLLKGDESPAFESMAQTIGEAAMVSGSPGRLKAWWVYRMLMSPDPLGERLTLMWHNHFATSNRKVQDLVLMREQNDLLRKQARAPFGELLTAVVKHPAMLAWLDADSNRKGHPNENLARELLELFTLGVGNYSETDVKGAARALTGWTIVGGRFAYREARHDIGEIDLFGTQGPLTGDGLLEQLLNHPGTSKRLAWRICQTFLGEDVVTRAALDELADGLAERELNIGWAVETVLRSRLFFSIENMRSRVLGPTEYVVGVLRALELREPPPSTLVLAEWASRMGQDLFYPPNVGGWNEGRAWLATRTVVARANFADALVSGRLWRPAREPEPDALVHRHSQLDKLAEHVNWLAKLLWGECPEEATAPIVKAARSAEAPLPKALALLLTRPEHSLA
ncbi:hypothetical protein Mal64_06760 [Pseudobythopirellula maris]|uniref:DUF1800 domain-containing protein n=1 Tax=Pseudobythopirellula maris TaxID=2527991 RepID=A0A5C5ZTV0_9BACT|nr:DUF1800 domain-containing protein [Pseudobythopirellula maris]TWT90291.1 hypothetical protein Mal64_06760 [Pseudobythopirellula maris]